MRDYKLKTAGLPDYVYGQVRAIVKNYETMRRDYDELLYQSPDPPDGQPRGGSAGDSTAAAGAKRADLATKLEAVEQSILVLPEEYRQGVWDNAIHGALYPMNAHRNTYGRYKAKFYRCIAKKMGWI